TTGNILYSGANILNVFFTRHLAQIEQSAGEGSVFSAALALERSVILVGALCSCAVFGALLVVAKYVGVSSTLIVLLIVLDTYLAYVADLARVLLQSLRRTVLLGTYTLMWMVCRLVFCVAGAVIFRTVWAALLGSILSTLIVFLGFYVWMRRSADPSPSAAPARFPVSTLVPTTIGYCLLILLSNLDVVLSYLVLSSEDLGFYSASSVFPKAILVVITPFLQMLFPMMLIIKANAPQFDLTILKIGGVVFLLTSAAAGMIWLFSGWLCGGGWGLQLCQSDPLHMLLLSTLPLVVLRLLVLFQYARGHDLIALWLALPVAAYFFIIANSDRTVEAVARGFTTFSAGACIFFLAVCFLAAHAREPRTG